MATTKAGRMTHAGQNIAPGALLWDNETSEAATIKTWRPCPDGDDAIIIITTSHGDEARCSQDLGIEIARS